jgi:hypothetical protein
MESFLHAFKPKFETLKANDKLTEAEKTTILGKTIGTYSGEMLSEKEATEAAKKILAAGDEEAMTAVLDALGMTVSNRSAAASEFTVATSVNDEDEKPESGMVAGFKRHWDTASTMEKVATVAVPLGVVGLIGWGAYKLFTRDSVSV